MLVLSRKAGERIVIDSGIVVTVLSVRGGRIRLGIEAPPGVVIKREELLLADSDVEEPALANAGRN